MTRGWPLGLITLGLVACAPAKHQPPRAAPVEVPVAARSTPDQVKIYDAAARRIRNDIDELYDHRVYGMHVVFSGYYKIKRLFVRPGPGDRVEADRLLGDIITHAKLQLECADALKDFGRRALAEDTIARARRVRRQLDLNDEPS